MITNSITRKEFHFHVYYLSLCLLVISLPTSRFMITVSLILLAANWVAEGEFKEKFRIFWNNKPFLAFSSIYLIHFIGVLWTKDLQFALQNDLLHKSPTLFMPLIIVTSPLPDVKKIRLLLILFISAVIFASLIGWIWSITRELNDFREISPFISSIYFSLMLIISAFHVPGLIKQISDKKTIQPVGWVISAGLIFFLLYSRSLSGIASLAGASLFSLFFYILLQKRYLFKSIAIVVLIVLIAGGIWLLVDVYKKTHTLNQTYLENLETHTRLGYPYSHDTLNIQMENGHLVFVYIAEGELEEAWKERSKLDFHMKDRLHHDLKYTLFRYMASKGLRKDREGIQSLKQVDIEAIEQGITNHKYLHWPGMYIRLHQMMTGLYVYRETGFSDPNWSTLTQRMDLWRSSKEAFRKYPIFGWGTGSILLAMDYGKQKKGSALIDVKMKPHNQYYYTLLSIGLAGLIITILLFAYFIIKSGAYQFYYFWLLIVIFGIHFIGNNTHESQLGHNLFVFFVLYYSYFYPQIIKKQ